MLNRKETEARPSNYDPFESTRQWILKGLMVMGFVLVASTGFFLISNGIDLIRGTSPEWAGIVLILLAGVACAVVGLAAIFLVLNLRFNRWSHAMWRKINRPRPK